MRKNKLDGKVFLISTYSYLIYDFWYEKSPKFTRFGRIAFLELILKNFPNFNGCQAVFINFPPIFFYFNHPYLAKFSQKDAAIHVELVKTNHI